MQIAWSTLELKAGSTNRDSWYKATNTGSQSKKNVFDTKTGESIKTWLQPSVFAKRSNVKIKLSKSIYSFSFIDSCKLWGERKCRCGA